MTNPNDPYRGGYPADHRDPYGADHRAPRDPAYSRPGDREAYVDRDRILTPGQERLATEPKPNPLAGILLIIGGLMGVLAGVVPSGGSQIPLAGTIDAFQTGETNAIVLAAAIILVFLCGLGALAAGAQMFAPKWHAGPARTGMTLGILMLIASLAVVIVAGTGVFDNAGFTTWMLLLACVPTLIGALVGFSRK
ncbi:hypothetical protein [Blastococcus sp. Marseille-P5729]|uniref:hypothetical protein n=1 Tax=Blastococcus sp. Marseille-P5729 TaxID=2086582 RepID=UPI00131D3404|nr:hypothetical protein [Blastococcus sp. Marseille-P5729]